MQSYLTSMKQGSAGVTLVYTATAGGRFGGSVFQEKYEMQQRNNHGLLRVLLSPWAVFPLPASMVSALVGAADRFDTITESNSGSRSLPSVLYERPHISLTVCAHMSSSQIPWNWAAGDGEQTALGTECGRNKQRGKWGCRTSTVSRTSDDTSFLPGKKGKIPQWSLEKHF